MKKWVLSGSAILNPDDTAEKINIQIENGYRVSELELRRKRLEEERSRLEAERSQLLNLDRVESIVTARLKYGYPRPEQFIKVFVP